MMINQITKRFVKRKQKAENYRARNKNKMELGMEFKVVMALTKRRKKRIAKRQHRRPGRGWHGSAPLLKASV